MTYALVASIFLSFFGILTGIILARLRDKQKKISRIDRNLIQLLVRNEKYFEVIESRINEKIDAAYEIEVWLQNENLLKKVYPASELGSPLSTYSFSTEKGAWLTLSERKYFAKFYPNFEEISVYIINQYCTKSFFVVFKQTLNDTQKLKIAHTLNDITPFIWTGLTANYFQKRWQNYNRIKKQVEDTRDEILALNTQEEVLSSFRKCLSKSFYINNLCVFHQGKNCVEKSLDDMDMINKYANKNLHHRTIQEVEELFYNQESRIKYVYAFFYAFGPDKNRSFLWIPCDKYELEIQQCLYELIQVFSKKLLSLAKKSIQNTQNNFSRYYFDEIPTLIFILDKSNTVVYSNKSAKAFKLNLGEKVVVEASDKKEMKLVLLGKEFYFYSFDSDDQLCIYIQNEENYKNKYYGELYTLKKISSVGALAAGIAHEIKNPLVPMKMLTKLLENNWEDEAFREKYVAIILPQIQRIIDLCNNLAALKNYQVPQKEKFDFIKLIEELKTALLPLESRGLIQINATATEAFVFGNYDQLFQMLMNLITNALEASDYEKVVSLKLSVKDTWLDILEIIDQGHGIKTKDMKNIFKLFFTTKENGNGLGLLMVKRILEQHKAILDIQSVEGEGTHISVKFFSSFLQANNLINQEEWV